MHRVAETYSFMYRDRSDDYTNEKLDAIVTRFGYPDCLYEISKHFQDSDKFADMMAGIKQMIQDHENTEGGIMRMGRMKLYEMPHIIQDMNREPIVFPTPQADFRVTNPSFITNDEITAKIASGSGVSDGKLRIYSFFKENHTEKEKVDFLKQEHSGSVYGSKGIVIERNVDFNRYDEITISFPKYAKMITQLIKENRYLTPEEVAELPRFEKRQLGAMIANFYSYAPSDLERPFDKNISYYWDKADHIGEQLENPDFVENVLEQMDYALKNTLSVERGFDSMQKAFDGLTAYQNGTYTVYPSQSQTQSKPAPTVTKPVDENDITRLASNLERNRKTALKSDEYGQLTLDFSAPTPVSDKLEEKGFVVSEELVDFAKEHLDDTATPDEIADKVVEIIAQDEREQLEPLELSEPVVTPTIEEVPPPTKEQTIAAQEQLIQSEQSVLAFLQEKAEHPNDVIGVAAGELLLFYGKDAEQVAPMIGSKLLQRDIPELGNSYITGTNMADWRVASTKLALQGVDFRFLGAENDQHTLLTEHKASDFIPVGSQVQYEGKLFAIEQVQYQDGTVYLRDVHSTLPVMQMVSVSHARDLVLEQERIEPQQAVQVEMETATIEDEPRYTVALLEEGFDRSYVVHDNEFDYDGWEKHQYPDLIYQAYPTKEEAQKAIDTLLTMEQAPTPPDILFFDNFNDLTLDYSKYNDQDVIGYNADGVKYTVGKSGSLVYTTQTTSITPYGEVLGDSMTPEIHEKFKAWKAEKDSVSFQFDGGLVAEPEEVPPSIVDTSPKHNFHITNDELGTGSLKEKFARNILAIETLKTIESENRRATLEEQQILHEYVGFGGLADAFDDSKTAWASEYQQLKGLLTESEYTSARASTLNAHYTAPVVIRSMYDAMQKMGVPQDGNILDPALGSGNFFGMLPSQLENSHLYGVELDGLTGRIATQLYQNADVQVKGFEKTTFPDNFFDMAVGNVPFGNYKVFDKRYEKQNFLIHDYFFGKTLDKVRAGGIVAFITSKGTLDKESDTVRRYLAERADLLGAIRLPNTAFKANANTEVTSDIIFLQKRDHAPAVMPSWVELGTTEDGVAVNQYFAENPQMVMGTMAMVSGPFGMESTCMPNTDTTLAEQLQNAITHLQMPDQTLLKQTAAIEETDKDTSISATPDVRNFSYVVVDDKVYYRENSRMNEVNLSAKESARVKDLIAVRDKTREIIEMQLDECSDEALAQAQGELNTLYDAYNKKHGLINATASKRSFASDVSYPLLCSLEKLDEEGKLKGKADMFTKRTIKNSAKITSVDTPSEALAVSISEKACVDIGFMAGLLGGSEKIPDVIDGLKGVIFKDPLTHTEGNLVGWLPADEYLSGNVREKLEIARAVAQSNPEFAVNVEMLEKVQPKELIASEIDVRIGATWIDPKYYAQFMFELLGTPRYMQGDRIDINYSKHTGEWNVRGKSEDRANPKSNATYGTKRKNAYAIMEDSLNLRDTRIYDKVYDDEGREKRVLNPQQTTIAQQKQEAIGEAFKEWVWKTPERREELTKVYNQIYNSTRPREFDGQHIKFDGMSPLIRLNKHQSNAVARTLYGGNTLLAHCVGAGKTFTMIAGAMESKRLGLNQKSLFVVPNHLTEQMGADIYQLYPGAKVLVATKKDFEPANRKTFCSRIATGDFDIVVIGHSQFEKVPLSVARQEAILQKQIDDILLAIEDAKSQNGERYTVKQLEKTKKSLETRLEKLASQERKDSVITFEELGVDKLYVDEGHMFKNLFLHTKMRNVAGIGQSEAQKSTDMFTKCRYMDELTGGKGVVFATGTPVSNSMTELYTMMRYLQYKTLEKLNLTHFDSWAANFGEKVTAIELAPEGTGFRAKTRFAKFFNLPELINIWKEASDIQTADMLNLPVPKAEHITVVTKPSEFQREMVESLAERADSVRKKEVEPNVDNMLKITSDGRKLALDQRLGNDMLADDEDSKINTCVSNVFNIWEESTDTLGTQIIFCDLSTPHYDGTFNVYDDIKNKLIEKGVPPDEIKFIHDASTEQQKAELFAKVRKGTVRVLIGSTAKCGAGTNIQTKLVALHHTDCPWRPADLEQREGRIVRQGNENKEVKIFKYVTENTFDAYNWSLIENKQRFSATRS
ncbi:N-6 DNA methylase [Bengtsoniella intestinalis]|uniref:N-6 DNA methylase n=1 Tax=Bengtsoniella intestinalis TaxID=3073143 RepID=UPI00391F6CEB